MYSAVAPQRQRQPDVEHDQRQPVHPGHREERRRHRRRDADPTRPVDLDLDAAATACSGSVRASSARGRCTTSAHRGSSERQTPPPPRRSEAVRRSGPAARPAGCTDPSPAPRSRRGSRPSRCREQHVAARVGPSRLESASEQENRDRGRRTKPIAFGIVHGCSGWSARVAPGVGPERSMPSSRRLVIRGSGELAPQVDRRLRSALTPGSAGTPGPAGPAPRSRPLASVRRPIVRRSGHPSSSASASFSPGPASRSS